MPELVIKNLVTAWIYEIEKKSINFKGEKCFICFFYNTKYSNRDCGKYS